MQWIIGSLIAFLAAGGGIVALVSYIHPSTAKLERLTVNCEVSPQRVRPGEAVMITVQPIAPNQVLVSKAAVVIRNFSSFDDGNGTSLDESRGFTNDTGDFSLPFSVPNSIHWEKTTFTVYVSKDGYQSSEEEVSVERKR
jgi:hypothetical protein